MTPEQRQERLTGVVVYMRELDETSACHYHLKFMFDELQRSDRVINYLYDALGPAADDILDMAYASLEDG